MILSNIVATTGCFTIIMATLYPIFYQYLTDKSITIGAPYFNSIFVPIIMLNILFASIGTSLNRMKFNVSFIVQLIAILIISYFLSDHTIKSFLCLGTSIFLLSMMIIRKKISPMIISHVGVAILVFAITIVTSHEQVIEKLIKPGEIIDFYNHQWQIKLETIKYSHGKNFLVRKASFNINNIMKLHPETRYYPVEEANTTECAIYSTIKGDLYISIGDYDDQLNQLVVRIQYKPMMNFIWVGGVMLFFGSMLGVYHKIKQD
jgi:cytochrome c biogenesis factor